MPLVVPGTPRNGLLCSDDFCSTSVYVLGLIVLAISIAPMPLHCCFPEVPFLWAQSWHSSLKDRSNHFR